MSRFTSLAAAMLMAGSDVPGIGGELNLYDWLAVAPVVAVGQSLGDDGKYTEVRLDPVIRGPAGEKGRVVRVRVQRANRDRDLSLDRKALRLDLGASYLLLLEPAGVPEDARPVFDLVRGVRGARLLPAEGAPALVEAVERFVEIQDLKDDRLVWSRLAALLEETQPTLIETALDEFIKFRRGDPELLPSIRPLLAHPAHRLRERATKLIGQILERPWATPIPESDRLLGELAALARRDGTVSVRIAATEALTAFRNPAVAAVLEEIAREDPDQTVRYTAEKWIYMRSEIDARKNTAN